MSRGGWFGLAAPPRLERLPVGGGGTPEQTLPLLSFPLAWKNGFWTNYLGFRRYAGRLVRERSVSRLAARHVKKVPQGYLGGKESIEKRLN